MELTSVQERTLRSLLGSGEGRPADPDLAPALRERLEAFTAAGGAGVPVRLSKERLNELARCQGLFDAALAGERPPFEHSAKSAAGTLLHKVLELEAVAPQEVDAADLVEAATRRLQRDRAFHPYWEGLDPIERGALAAEGAGALELFRASFPSLGLHRRALAPTPEQWIEVHLGGGSVVLLGRVDLLLGVRRPARSTRVLLDLKTGDAWPEHAEDMRLYALMFTLRQGVPPFRVGTFFLRSGECQVEDVDGAMLSRAADRVEAAVATARRLAAGETAALTPGQHCRWCPQRPTCPAAAAAATIP